MADTKLLIETSAEQVKMADGTTVENKMYNHTHTKSNITDFPTTMKNPNALTISLNGVSQGGYDGSAAKSINITASAIGAAVSSHTHNYAGSSTAGGAATSANKVNSSLVVTLNGGTSEGSDKFTFNGSAAKTIDITADAIGASSSDHTHTKSDITDFPTSLKNPNALTISLNGTSQGAYDGSAAKSVNITPASIGAAASSHTHTKSQITDFPTSLKNPNALTINGTAYDGSAAQSFSLATSDHTHSYAASSTVGGSATSAEKVNNNLVIKLNGGTTEGTNLFTFNGSAVKTINITASSIGAAVSSHTHNYAGSSSAGGAATSANKVNSSLSISINDGETEDTDLFTFNGSSAKSINLTPDLLGAANASHTHTKSQITDFPTALKNPSALTINGTAYDGSAAKTFSLATSDHTHNYAGSSSAGGAATSANKVNTNLVIKLNGGTTEGTNLFTFNGSAAKSINITPSNIGAAASSHTHSYAGSSTAGGAATSANKVNNSLAISINGGTTEDTDLFTFNGSTAKSIDLTPDLLRAANASHTHTKSDITDFPTSLKNPSALTINGTAYDGSAAKSFSLATSDHTHNYAGSSSAGGAATSANKVNTNLVIKLNGGTSEGTNLFTFNGSTAKTINITPSSIGAALSSHTHSYAGSSSAGGAANSVANALTISLNGTSQGAYNGSAAKSINVTPSAIGAAASSHTHTESDISGTISASKISGVLSLDNIPKGALERVVTVADDTARYALTTDSIQLGDTVKVTSTGLMYIIVDESKLNSADGYMEYTAGSAASVPWSGVTGKPSSMKNPNALTINGTAYDGSAAVSLSLATSGHTHNYAGSSSAGGVANSAAKVTNALTVKLNGGSTEGTNLFTFDGSAAKSVNITASNIGAAASSHTHNYAGSSSAGGAATSANKVNKNLVVKLNGGSTEDTDLFTFNGSTAKTIDITADNIGAATSDHTHSYAGSSSVGGAATSALKVANALTINGTTYDGSAAKSFNLAVSSHTHNYAGSSSAGGAANSVANSMVVKLNGGTTEGTDLFTFNGSAAKSINITPSVIGAAASSHTHNYAGSSSAGGSATSAVKLSTARAIDGVNFDGSAAITHYGACDTASATAAKVVALANFTLVTGARVAVKFTAGSAVASATLNVNSTGAKAIFYKGAAIAASNKLIANNIYEFVYDGTNWVLVGDLDTNTTYTALKNPNALTISLNGTSQGAYDGSAAKSVNITPASIGAATSSHTHNYAGSSSAGGSATSAVKLSTARKINGVSFDGTADIEIPANYATALTNEDLDDIKTIGDYYGAGGNTVTNKPTGVEHFGLWVYKGASGHIIQRIHGSDEKIYFRRYDSSNWGSWNREYTTVNKPTVSEIGAAASSHTHSYAGSSSAGGAANSVANSIAIKLNGGTTEGTNLFTFNGSAAKSINITPSAIGAAASSHTHSYAGSSSAGGSATSAVKLSTARAIDGVNFDGSAAITHYGSCSTASATAAKVVSLTGFTLVTGARVAVKFTAGSAVASATLNVNSTGAKAIFYKGAAITASNKLVTNNIYEFVYDGTNWVLVGDLDTNTTYTSLKNPNALTISLNGTSQGAYDGSAAKSIDITPSSIGAATSSHTHNYAGSSSAGGAATSALKVANALTINGTAYDGSAAQSFSLATSSHTHNYAASSSAGGAATNVTGTLTNPTSSTTYYVPFHSGASTGSKALLNNNGLVYITLEGTTSAAGTAILSLGNSTASGTAANKQGKVRIYSASSGYTEIVNTSSTNNYTITLPAASGTVALTSSNVASATKVGNNLVIKLNGGSTEGTNLFTFNGSAAKTVNITPSSIGAAASSHTHNYAGSSSAGGVATEAAKTTNAIVVKLNGGSTEGTNLFTFNGSAAKTVNITASGIGAAASSHTHSYAGSSSAGGAANSVANSIAIKLNGGATEGTNLFTFNGSAAKSIDITPSAIGAAASSHTHNYAGSSSAGGSATTVASTLTNPTSATTYYVPFFSGEASGAKTVRDNNGIRYSTLEGTTTADGYSILILGNSTASKTDANKQGKVRIYSVSSGYTDLVNATSTSNYTITLPAATGTVALTSSNVASATKLVTARNIDGVSFNGTASIIHYGSCSTAGDTAAKEVSCTGFALVTGARISVKFSSSNTAASPTLNVNSTGAKPIYYNNAAITGGSANNTNPLKAANVVSFVYDGTYYRIEGSVHAEHASASNTVNSSASTTTSNLYLTGVTAANGTHYYSSKVYIVPNTGALTCVNLNSTGVITQSSDERLKDDFRTLSDDFINAYNELNIVSFVFKDRKNNDPRAIGVIAQQVLEVFDKYNIDAKEYGIVVEREDGYLSVNYEHLDSLSIMVNQKQQEKIDMLIDKLNDLEQFVYRFMK